MATQQNRTNPREVILDVATRLFSETGYAGTTMRDIANAVGVLPGSLYAHIDGKETLLFEIIESGIDRFLAAAAEIDEFSDPADKMRAAIKAHLRVVADSPERTLVVFHHWRYLTGKNRKSILDKRRRYEEIFTRLLEDGIAGGAFDSKLDAKVARLSILGSLNWSAEWLKPNGRASTEQVGERLANTILHGLLSD